MPYELRKQGEKYCVFNKETGANKGCSDTEEKGKAHMRALYANEKKELDVALELLDFDNTDPNFVQEKAVDAAHTHEHMHGHYHDHEHNGESHSHYHGHEHEHEHDHSTYDHAHYHTMHEGDMEAHEHDATEEHVHADSIYKQKAFVPPVIKPRAAPTLLDKLKDVTLGPQALTLFKDESTGRTRVLMRVSNMFKDRHGEIITSEAHHSYVKYLDEHPQEMPEFWVWHIPGSRWGQADFVDFSDGFLSASGLVDEGMEQVAEKLSRRDYGVSHGFRGVSLTGKGYIDAYKSFEFSPLPRDQAANIFTAIMMAKEITHMDTAKREKLLGIGLSEELLNKWESDSKGVSEALKELGIQFKDTEPEPDPPNPTPDPQPNPEPTLADVLGQITRIANRMEAVEKKQKELDTRVDDSVASVLEAAIAPGQTKGHVATQSKDNKPSDEQVKKDDTWLNELLLKGV